MIAAFVPYVRAQQRAGDKVEERVNELFLKLSGIDRRKLEEMNDKLDKLAWLTWSKRELLSDHSFPFLLHIQPIQLPLGRALRSG